MIRHISLKNFQCHAHRSVALEQVTVFTGPNGSGKSTFVRALRWAALNEWPGRADTFMKWGTDFSTVKFWTEQHCVERVKSKSGDNFYKLDGKMLKFDTVDRKRPPQAVLDAHKLTPENFQGQRDGALWFDLTAGQSARALNKIVNLESIDDALDRAADRLRQARMREKVCQERLTEAVEKSKSLSWVEEMDRRLKELEDLNECIVSKRARIASAERSILEVSRAVRVRDRALALAKRGAELASLGERILKLRGEADELGVKIQVIQEQEVRKCQLEKELRQKESQLAELMAQGCPLCGRSPTPS